MSSLPVYRGPFGRRQAERLLWRAGFGPRKGEAEALARLGLDGAVQALTRPGPERLVGPPPRDRRGNSLAPTDASGHDHAWWLDRMVRTSRPLVERMTLVWHDWFATSNVGVGSQRFMLAQNGLLRRHALGSFESLLLELTRDPAMLVWLSGNRSEETAPNENYARELMELFTLGAGKGYTERDVREQARALTGWRSDFRQGVGWVDFRYDPARHDAGFKRVFGRRGRFDWKDACRLCLEHPAHPEFLVRKLWSYFVPEPPAGDTRRGLERLYRAGGRRIRPLLEAILRHPALHEGPRMTKPPVVVTAGLLRTLGTGVRTEAWAERDALSGQRLFYPPSVAGWDEEAWLDTATFRGRWNGVAAALAPRISRPGASEPVQAPALVRRARAFLGDPTLTSATTGALTRFAARALADADTPARRRARTASVENALRLLIAASPDFQTC
ncbi:MAG: DUF1800 domain-containing protein [Actinobacteria bacterium]|nr:DUF1800 domain-containing protein [Actinomycetota bacterium]